MLFHVTELNGADIQRSFTDGRLESLAHSVSWLDFHHVAVSEVFTASELEQGAELYIENEFLTSTEV